jgi:predicted RNA-binding Zn ribbon-like protein
MMITSSMRIVSRSFSPRDLVSGDPALDLVNTVTARNTATPIDWLDGYSRVVEWARLAGVVESGVLSVLQRRAAADNAPAEEAVGRLKHFRELLHTAYTALIRGERVPEAALAQLMGVLHEARGRQTLEYRGEHVELRSDADRSGLDLVRDCLADRALALLLRLPDDRVRICRGERCGWLFIDSSKGAQRVWCDMATCGNAAKSQRYLNAQRRSRRGRGADRS